MIVIFNRNFGKNNLKGISFKIKIKIRITNSNLMIYEIITCRCSGTAHFEMYTLITNIPTVPTISKNYILYKNTFKNFGEGFDVLSYNLLICKKKLENSFAYLLFVVTF